MTDSVGAGAQMSATPGAVLAAAREAAGLTTADAAGQMRISLRQLEAIEADRYDDLPGPVFVRGFVRNYARLLDLDPLPLLHALEPALGGEVPLRAQQYAGALPVHARRGHTRWWIGLLVLFLVVVLGAAAYEFWRGRAGNPTSTSETPPVTTPATSSSATVAEPVPLTPERVVQPAAESAPSASAAEPGTTAAIAPAVPVAAESGAAAEGGRIELAFVADSWVEVRDKSGTVVFQATGTANTTRTVEGAPPLTVTIGNASGVRLTYNRKPIDVAANANRNIARLTLE